jgi:hypothetical protein
MEPSWEDGGRGRGGHRGRVRSSVCISKSQWRRAWILVRRDEFSIMKAGRGGGRGHEKE